MVSTKIEGLFQSKIGDENYFLFIENGQKNQKKILIESYEKYKKYLDTDFISKFPKEFFSRLWELKLISNFEIENLEPIKKKNNQKSPDFCIKCGPKIYYIECVSAKRGSADKYSYLNTPIEDLFPNNSKVSICRDGISGGGHREYRERVASAFKYKANCMYNPSLCSTKCNHEKTGAGYKEMIGECGYIIAISTADIPSHNQPNNNDVTLSFFFPMNPYETIIIDKNKKIIASHHEYSESFKKENEAEIGTDIFSDKKYAHVSAVIISDKLEIPFRNTDILLIKNPNASYKSALTHLI